MASELRVNTINSRTGFGTITVSETGQDLVGITTIANLTTENTLVGAAASFTGNVQIGGVLTYEDVTNIDSVGLITARSGIEVGARPGVGASISVDGNAIFSGVTTTTTLKSTTIETTGDIAVKSDSGKFLVGAGEDLQLFHDGGSSIIRNTNNGASLYLQGSSSGTNNIKCEPNGGTQIMHNGTAVIYTEAATLRANDNVKLRLGSSSDFTMYHDGSHNLIEGSTASQNIRFLTTPSGGSATERLKITHDGKVVIDNATDTLTIGGDNVYNSSKVNLQVGSMTQTSATTESTAIVIHDQNSKRNGTESAGSWVSGIRFMSTQINGGSRYGAFINQDIKYNNFSGGATKMRSDLVFGTRGDAQTGTGDPPIARMRIQHDGNIGIAVAEPKSLLHVYGPGDIRMGSSYGGVANIALQVEFASGYTGTHYMFEITDSAAYTFNGSHIAYGGGGSSYGINVTYIRMVAGREAGAANSGDTWRNGTHQYNSEVMTTGQIGLNPGAGSVSFAADDTPDGAASGRSLYKIAFSASGQSTTCWGKIQGTLTWGATSTGGRVKIKDKDGNVLWDSNP